MLVSVLLNLTGGKQMLDKYWPQENQIYKCIRTEAEELSDHVLMAVHEPMTLVKSFVDDNDKSKVFSVNAERELLKNLKMSSRPVPILGDSGSGKSHLIRLLDIKLRQDPDCKNWLIKRIPKSASLREVLTILLDGLEGDVFDDARQKIAEVDHHFTTREVADHLIVFMGHRLQDKYTEMQSESAELKQNATQVDSETIKRMQSIQRHAKSSALPALLGDSDYKEVLIRESGCIFKMARRLTSGSTGEELFETDNKISASDLDLSPETINLGDLSRTARDYVSSKGLTQIPGRLEEAVSLLNEVLSEACNNVFQKFFQLHGGNFLDLFSEIRRHLIGRTLVILVEDMSLITAIESDLITSLTREGIRDGHEEMCVVRSAIAVTTGYEGYKRHRNSIVGRNAGYEWIIKRSIDNSDTLAERVQNFCGRYLNAARHGDEQLKALMSPSTKEVEYATPIWGTNEKEDTELIDAFGFSSKGYPLFPFNKSALDAYANKFCKEKASEELVFNPRIVLQHILIENLTSYRDSYLKNKFPPVGLGDFSCRASLAGEIKRRVFKDIERSLTLSSIWGYGANTLGELAGVMPAGVAREFSLSDLASCLDGTVPENTPVISPHPSNTGSTIGITKPSKPSGASDDTSIIIEDNVEKWFANKAIEQKAANILRQRLHDLIVLYSKNLLQWASLKSLPKLKVRNIPLIYIHYNQNQPDKTYASFGSEKEFEKNSQDYKSFLIAVLRNEHYGNWRYEKGYSDYCQYQNFISNWVPKAIIEIVNKAREGLKDKLIAHLTLAVGLDPIVSNKTISEKLSFLCKSSEEIAKDVQTTGITEWDDIRASLLSDWDEKQQSWLDLVSINNHAIEGDLVIKALRGITIDKFPYSREVQKAQQKVKTEFGALDIFKGVSNKESFDELIRKMLELVKKMASNNQYQGMDGQLTSRKFINRITTILEGCHWMTVKSVLVMFEPFDVKPCINALNNFVLADAEQVRELIKTWSLLYKSNKQRMQNENVTNGGVAREGNRKQLDIKMNFIQKNISKLVVMEKENV